MGVWENNEFIGAIIFGLGGGAACNGRRYGLKRNFEIVELQRIALQQHRTSVSRIVAIALKMLKSLSPGLRLVVSYADTAQGHLGNIYQAGNWIYIGQTAKDWYALGPDGRKYHSRIAHTHVQFGIRKTVNVSKMPRIETPPKHRYLMPLDNEIRHHILSLAKPYPKRATSETVDTSVHQTEERGSTPTVALQPKLSNSPYIPLT